MAMVLLSSSKYEACRTDVLRHRWSHLTSKSFGIGGLPSFLMYVAPLAQELRYNYANTIESPTVEKKMDSR